MVVLYSIAAVVLAVAVLIASLTALLTAFLDHRTLARHDREGQNRLVLSTLVELRAG